MDARNIAAPRRRNEPATAVVAAATLTVDDIKVETPSDAQSSACAAWPIWTCEPSEFPWYYDQNEQCLILEGEAIVTPDGGSESVTIGVGNLVTFPQGMGCTWKVTKAIKKHYNFY
ncbi:unnamed protein product [Pedinophyceae sp. YPF-701]|nr:unnamed protein product [Pedinophyceae sp. YPF-701]